MAHEASFREAFEDFIEDKLYQGALPLCEPKRRSASHDYVVRYTCADARKSGHGENLRT